MASVPAPGPGMHVHGGTDRHQRVVQMVLQEIRKGRWPVGSLLPSETLMSEIYSLSRYGIREVMQTLVNLGVVSRQQGIGTRVLSDRESFRYTQRCSSLDDLAQYTRGTRYLILRRRRFSPRGELREALRATSEGHWLQLTGLRYAGDQTIAYATVYINPRYAHLPTLGKTVHAPIFSLIEDTYRVRIERVEEEINAVLVPKDASGLLGVASGSPALRVVRRYFVDDEVIEMTDGCHPARHFSYTASFEVERLGAS